MNYHEPVLLKESIQGLNIKKSGIYVDVTYGGGGHSKEILSALEGGKLYSFDQDADAWENEIDDERFTPIHQNFRFLKNSLRALDVTEIDGILADLGISSHQIDTPDRGFSTRFDATLDMRMNVGSDSSALDILNEYSEMDLVRVLKNYGDLNNASKLAQSIIAYRQSNSIQTKDDLKKALTGFYQEGMEMKFLAKVFQALRIEVNDELGALRELLKQCEEMLHKDGRLVVISYHSLEDRMVKNFIKTGNIEGNLEKDIYGVADVPYKMINKKPIVPSDEELKRNKRSRSAKLRIAQKIKG